MALKSLRSRPLILWFTAPIVLLSAVACGGDDATKAPVTASPTQISTTPAPATESPEGVTLATDLKEFAIAANPASVAPGRVTVTAKNSGAVLHELVLIKSDADPKSLAIGADGAVDESALESPGEIEDIAAGASAKAEFNLDAGKYLLICNIPGHYAGGMVASITVQ